jgi:hypothetical protein
MKYFATVMLAFGIMLGAALPAARADTTCTQEISGGTIYGNIVVPNGNTCVLSGVMVTGNVIVQANARLNIDPFALTTIVGNVIFGAGTAIQMNLYSTAYLIVDGNVTANRCAYIIMTSVTIGGNFSAQNCTGAPSGQGISGQPTNTTVDGNFTCTGTAGACGLFGITVKGNVQIKNNGSGIVLSNIIGGNLQCSGNTGGVNGSGNTVDGQKSGQCANF